MQPEPIVKSRVPFVINCAITAMLIMAIVTVLALILPDAIVREMEFNENVAHSRCMKHGDFDEQSAYCRAVARASNQ